MIRTCPNCGTDIQSSSPRKSVKCHYCNIIIQPTRTTKRGPPPPAECACCGSKATKTITEGLRMCDMCYEFSGPYMKDKESMKRYIASGGAAVWLMAGLRHFMLRAPVGSVSDIRKRDIPTMDDLRKRPGTRVQGGVPFGFSQEGDRLVHDDQQQLTLQVIRTMMSRKSSYISVARELTRLGRPNKHGKTSWSASSVRFLALREGWAS